MKAIRYSSYGSPDVLRYEEVDKPTAGDDEVLIRVRAASVNALDLALMRGTPYPLRIMAGLRKPKNRRLGVDVAGHVEVVGRNIRQFKPGDDVFGACRGAFAEYACTKESALVIKPAGVTFEQAASANIAGLTALQALRDTGKIQPGQKVLINGAGGGVGSFAVQIAKSFGADVTCATTTGKMDMVRSIGADRVIDYTREDFTESAQRYDLIVDCYATRSLSACRRVLIPSGRYVMVGGPVAGFGVDFIARVVSALVLSKFVNQNLVIVQAKRNKDDLAVVAELIETGKVTPAIDGSYSLSETPEAIRYLETGNARGKVVITV